MTSAERRAVGFFAALAAAGAGARVFGIGDPPGARPPTPADRLALQRQLEAVDSAHARKARGRTGERSGGRGARRRRSADSAASVPAEPRAAGPVGRAAGHRVAEVAGPVNVNEADSAALEALPGVGPALARRIVADRAAHGAYRSMTELSRVPGIGAGLERRLAGAVRFGVAGGGVTFTGGGRPLSGSVPRAAAGWPPP